MESIYIYNFAIFIIIFCKQIYEGDDIDFIEITSEIENNGEAKNSKKDYKYRLVMHTKKYFFKIFK